MKNLLDNPKLIKIIHDDSNKFMLDDRLDLVILFFKDKKILAKKLLSELESLITKEVYIIDERIKQSNNLDEVKSLIEMKTSYIGAFDCVKNKSLSYQDNQVVNSINQSATDTIKTIKHNKHDNMLKLGSKLLKRFNITENTKFTFEVIRGKFLIKQRLDLDSSTFYKTGSLDIYRLKLCIPSEFTKKCQLSPGAIFNILEKNGLLVLSYDVPRK